MFYINTLFTTFISCTTFLFILGISGIILFQKSILIILMCIEIILVAVNLNLIFFSFIVHDIIGRIFVLLTITVAAAEVAVLLAILVIYFRQKGSIKISLISTLKG